MDPLKSEKLERRLTHPVVVKLQEMKKLDNLLFSILFSK